MQDQALQAASPRTPRRPLTHRSRRRSRAPLCAALLAALGLCASSASAQRSAERAGPGRSIPDQFYPGFDHAKDVLPAPRKGGSVTVHLSNLPKSMNYMIENSAVTRWMLYEAHEYLIQRNWETWEYEPRLAESWVEEDTLILAGGRGADNANILYGDVEEVEGGYKVVPRSAGNPLGEPRVVPKADVQSLEKNTVFTFKLRPGIKWQDDVPLSVEDVLFSWACYKNPVVQCDSVRFQFEKLLAAEKVDERTVRFFYENQYFLARGVFDSLTILPRHLYDLRDPRHPQHDPKATDAEVGKHVNENKHNTMWVGLGPYKVHSRTEQVVVARRWDGYYDPANGGYVDEIRWRHIPNDDAAMQAVINGELDFFDRVTSEDYFGAMTLRPEFTQRFYKGHYYRPTMGYVVWNMRRDLFKDVRVRKALSMVFDWDEYIRTVYRGLAERVTGATNLLSPNYNREVPFLPYDVEGAEDLLSDAGWYDRDGDGIIDKDGRPFEFQFLMPTGNAASTTLGQKLQEDLKKVGIRMSIATREWATFMQLLQGHDFDAANLAWILTPESDPEQLWHSKWADRPGSNHGGLQDAKVDELIEKIQRELDDEVRRKLFHELHARLYELQPYQFGLNVPTKFAMNRKVRNFQAFAIAPGYSVRRWYVIEPGTEARPQ